MTTEFTDLNLHPQLVQAVTERGYLTPMPIQAAIIPLMIAGEDVTGQAQTGTGKTAAFALPILNNLEEGQNHVQGLVLVPTRELALQVADFITEYGRHRDVRVLAVYGGAAYSPQINQLRRGVEIVVGTPGRLMDLMERQILDLSRVRTVVLDEADEMLSMGFIEDIETILAATPATRQTALFSATLPPEIRRLAERYLHNPQPVAIHGEQVTLAAIEQRYYLVNEADKTAALTRLFEVEEISSALIFVRTRAGTSELANELSVRGFPAEALNGDLSQDARERTLNRFRQNKVTVLVATDVAARGLDIDDISHVFNFDLPDDPELYVHRIGRTGRAGKNGIAISLMTPAEKRLLRQIEAFTRQKLARSPLPTEEDIRTHREQKLVGLVALWLKRGRCLQERAIVEKLAAEGHDPLQIAAAALKIARADEKQRPIAPVSEVVETRYESRPRRAQPAYSEPHRNDARGDSPRPRTSHSFSRSQEMRFSTVSHEPGMVRLSLSLGRQHGIRPTDIVGAIASQADIPGRSIGKIHIQDSMSLVDVPEEYVLQVLEKGRRVHIHRQPADLQRA
jgi:ATP-dependent RNA helicase DeaD